MLCFHCLNMKVLPSDVSIPILVKEMRCVKNRISDSDTGIEPKIFRRQLRRKGQIPPLLMLRNNCPDANDMRKEELL